VSYAFSLARSLVRTSFPPQSCIAAPQYTRDHLATTTLPYTNHVTHIFTQKTCIANHNKICPKTAQEDTVGGSVSSTLGPSQYDPTSLPMYRHRTHINSALSLLFQESNSVATSNIFSVFPSSFHTPFSYLALLLSFGPHQEIPHVHQTSPNHNVLYAVNKDIFKIINNK
jgi:hypothetical protein